MNNRYDTIDETYLENKLGLYNVKNIEIIEYITLFQRIIHSNNPDKINLINQLLNLVEQQNKILEFLKIGILNFKLLENICYLNNENLFDRIIILLKDNQLLSFIIEDNIKYIGDLNITINIIINCLFTFKARLTDNISIKLCELLDEYYVQKIIEDTATHSGTELKQDTLLKVSDDKNILFSFTKVMFELMRTTKLIVIEYIINMYIKYDILEYIMGKSKSEELIDIISIFSYQEIIENISLDLFEQIIYKFEISDYNCLYFAEVCLGEEKYNQTNEISERYLILYTKLKNKI